MPFFVIRDDISNINTDILVNTTYPAPALCKSSHRIDIIPPTFDKYNVEECKSSLSSLYNYCFEQAVDKGARSIAFPLVVPRNYEQPEEIALSAAISSIERFLINDNDDITVFLTLSDFGDRNVSGKLYGDIDSYIDDYYVPACDFLPLSDEGCDASDSKEDFTGCAVFGAPLTSTVFGISKKKDYFAKERSASLPQRSLDDVMNNKEKSFMEMVFWYAGIKGLEDTAIYKGANLDRKAFSKLRSGSTRNPGKSTALALALSLKLNLDETKDLLARAGYALSPCFKTDIIVQYFIEKEAYNIHAVNIALFEHGEECLGSKIL